LQAFWGGFFVSLTDLDQNRGGFPSRSVRALRIRVEHFLEHLEVRQELPRLLQECRRCLVPGGVLRVIVPHARRFMMAYLSDDTTQWRDLGVPVPFPEDLPMPLDVVNHVFHQWHEHRWAYDVSNLGHRLRAAGFREVHQMAYGTSLLPPLAADLPQHQMYSLYVDAIR